MNWKLCNPRKISYDDGRHEKTIWDLYAGNTFYKTGDYTQLTDDLKTLMQQGDTVSEDHTTRQTQEEDDE